MVNNPFITSTPVVLRDLPASVRGFVCLGSDYEPIIVLNSSLSREQQMKTYRHELNHILRGEVWDSNYNEYGDGNE